MQRCRPLSTSLPARSQAGRHRCDGDDHVGQQATVDGSQRLDGVDLAGVDYMVAPRAPAPWRDASRKSRGAITRPRPRTAAPLCTKPCPMKPAPTTATVSPRLDAADLEATDDTGPRLYGHRRRVADFLWNAMDVDGEMGGADAVILAERAGIEPECWNSKDLG